MVALNLDVSKLTQSAAMKATPHDNCIVLDLGTGSFPRDIEVRLPDDDGARQNALWDGSLNLSVNDEVLCFEYAGISAWRVMAMGGKDGGAGKVRVSEVWESDFGNVALESDATANITINTGTLTIPSDVIHLGDPDTNIAFTDDDVEATVGGLSMLKLTEAAQDLIKLGPGSGDVDVDINGDLFLEGSTGNFGIGETSPAGIMHVKWASSTVAPRLEFTGAGNLPATYIFFHNSATPANNDGLGEFRFAGNNDAGTPEEIVFSRIAGFSPTITDGSEGGELRFSMMIGGTNRSVGRWIEGDLGIGNNVTPLAKLHVDQFSTSAAIPVVTFDQADVDEPFEKYIGTAAAANLTRSIVDDGDVTTATLVGWTKIEIDDVGNQVADGDYFRPFYSLA